MRKAHGSRLDETIADTEFVGRVRALDADSVQVFVHGLHAAFSEMNDRFGVPIEKRRLVEACSLRASLPVFLWLGRVGTEDLVAVATALWAEQVLALGVHDGGISSLARQVGPRPEPVQLGDEDIDTAILAYSYAVDDYWKEHFSGDANRTDLGRMLADLELSYDDAGRMFGVSGETVRRWGQGVSRMPVEQSAKLHAFVAALARLKWLFKLDRLPAVVRRPAPMFAGESALDLILRGQISDVAARYDAALRYQA